MNKWAIIFEDKVSTPSSVLLKSCVVGDIIYFSDGNINISSCIEERINKDKCTNILVFVDVNVLNPDTEQLYSYLIDMKSENESWKGVILVPIICIEYIIGKMCITEQYFTEKELGNEIVKNVFEKLNLDSLSKRLQGMSLEKVCKEAFSVKSRRCENCRKNSLSYGLFYIKDCLCTGCRLYGLSQQEKANKLYYSLPIVYEYGDDIDSENLVILRSIQEGLQELYNEISKQLGIKSGFKVRLL